MTDGTDWRARLLGQGIDAELVASAVETAKRHSAAADALERSPHHAAGPDGHLARLRSAAPSAVSSDGRDDAFSPATELETLVQNVRTGAISASAVATAHLAALKKADAALNAVARLEPTAALAMAADIDDRRARGEALGPLAGAPLAHKDLYGRAGWRMEAGARILEGDIATSTATAIDALDKAGALDLGRLNTVEFALGPDGRNVHTGAVRNPWNPEHVTGGSSSGSAAAVAAGAVPAALGSDTGGSIRLPAAACGLVGVKPTAGLIGRSGVWPLAGSLDTVGPLARTVRDAARLVQTMAGPDAGDPQSTPIWPLDLLSGLEDGLTGLRIGVAETYFFDELDEDVAAPVDAARALLAAEGAALSTVAIPAVETANQLNSLVINVEASYQHRDFLASRAAEYGPETLGRIAAGVFTPASAYLAALMRRESLLAATLDGPLAEVDLVFTPVWPFEPPKLAGDDVAAYLRRVDATGRCTRPVNFLGLPAVVIPCGVSPNGVPVAIQLIGRPFDEARLLRAARAFERARAFAEEHQPQIDVTPSL